MVGSQASQGKSSAILGLACANPTVTSESQSSDPSTRQIITVTYLGSTPQLDVMAGTPCNRLTGKAATVSEDNLAAVHEFSQSSQALECGVATPTVRLGQDSRHRVGPSEDVNDDESTRVVHDMIGSWTG